MEKKERNEQSLQEIWDYVKRPNLCMISVTECDGENESKLKNTLQDIIQENFPNKVGQCSNSGKRENTTKIFLKKSNPKAHNHQIHKD